MLEKTNASLISMNCENIEMRKEKNISAYLYAASMRCAEITGSRVLFCP